MSCLVCKRIPPKEIARFAHEIFKGNKKEDIHKIIVEVCKCVNYADSKNRVFLCGHPERSVLGGLFYLRAKANDIPITLLEILRGFNMKDNGTSTLTSSWKRWINEFPELFPEVIEDHNGHLLVRARLGYTGRVRCVQEDLKRKCRATPCPMCEANGVISNMHRATDYVLRKDKFICDTCKTEIWG